jgi:hypothetical protein
VAFGRGMMDTYQGVKQLFLEKFGDDEEAERYTKQVMNDIRLYQQLDDANPWLSKISRFGGNVASLPAPGVGPAATTSVRLGKAALTGATQAGTQFVEEGGSRLENALLGGAFGAGGDLALGGITKSFNALRRKPNFTNKSAEDIYNLAKQTDVPVSTGDMLGDTAKGTALSVAERTSEFVPIVGMGSFREQQHNAFKKAMINLKADSVKYVGTDDLGEAVQTGVLDRLAKLKVKSDTNYKALSVAADRALKESSEVTIPTNELNKVAKNIHNRTKFLFGNPEFQDQKLLDLTKRLAQDPEARNFQALRQLRMQLADRVDAHYAGSELIGKQGVVDLMRLKEAVEKDMADFAKQKGGQVFKLWKKADSFHKSQVVPYKEKTLKQFNGKEIDSLTSFWLQRGKFSKAAAIYKASNAEGKSAMRASVIDDIVNHATQTGKDGVISPQRFASRYEQYKKAINSVFVGDKALKARLEGMAKLAKHVTRAGQFMEKPPTGLALGQGAIAYGAPVAGALNPTLVPGMLKAGALTWAFKKAETSPAIQKLLLSASRYQPESKGMQRVMNQLYARFELMMGALPGQIQQAEQ